VSGPAKALIALAHIPEPWLDYCSEMITAANRLLVERNHVAHGLWLAVAEDNGHRNFSSHKAVRHAITRQVRQWNLTELHDLAREMAEVAGRMQILAFNLPLLLGGGSASGLLDWPDPGTTFVGLYAPRPGSFGYQQD
jgi:hypothetical protein